MPSKKTQLTADELQSLVETTLNDAKAVNITTINLRGIADFADYMIICSGTSSRHVKSIADKVVQAAKDAGEKPFGVEGEREAEWILVDLSDVVINVMQEETRELYALEKLWHITDEDTDAETPKITCEITRDEAGKLPKEKLNGQQR